MAEKFYRAEGDELCYELETFKIMLEDNPELKEMTVREYKRKTGTGTFWCVEQGEGYESGEGVCGALECSDYDPRNGKSGRCRWHSDPLFPTENSLTLVKRPDNQKILIFKGKAKFRDEEA